MSELRTEGQGNVPERPVLVIPNRLNLTTLRELEKLLGGNPRVAWMVEMSMPPTADVMEYLNRTRTAGFMYSAKQQSREMIAEMVHDRLAQGRHVVLLPGQATQMPAGISGVPGHLLSLFDSSSLSALPVYTGGTNDSLEEPLTTREDAAVTELRIMPVQRAGAGLGSRVLAAWMEAGADSFAKHPVLQHHTLPDLLLRSLMAHPTARLMDGVDDSALTYRELLALAIMFVRVLKKQTQHRRIGILLPPGKSAAIANLACLLCGIVPVNFNYHAEYKEFTAQVAATGVTRFITEERFVHKQHRFAWPRSRDLIYVDRELTELGANRLRLWCHLLRFFRRARVAKAVQLAEPTAETEAAVFFTAGAGGSPRPVSMTHRMLLAAVLQMQCRVAGEQTDSVLCAHPLYRVTGFVLSLLMPLLYGRDIVTYPDTDTPKRLCALMRQYSIRMFTTTPAVLRNILEHATEDTFTTVKLCITAGEKLPDDLEKDAQRCKLTVCDGYGLAETAGLFSLNLPTPADAAPLTIAAGKSGCVGTPLWGTAIRISDPNRPEQALPPNVPGLLWVRGAAVAKEEEGGDRPATEQRYGAWLCTGDIAGMDADGMLTIGGRRNRFSRLDGVMVPHDHIELVLGRVLKLSPAAMRQHPICIVSIPDRGVGEKLLLLSTVHRTATPNDLLTMRYGIMNEGSPSSWTPWDILPVKRLPLTEDGRPDIPACYALAKKLLAAKRR